MADRDRDIDTEIQTQAEKIKKILRGFCNFVIKRWVKPLQMTP